MTSPPKRLGPERELREGRISPKIAADLCRESVFVEFDTRNKEVFDIFDANSNLLNVAVISEGKIVGLINRDSYMRSMARPFFKELYWKKHCDKLMDEAAVVVEADTSVRELANQLLNTSSEYRLSDGFVITRGKKLLGTGLTSEVLAAILAIERLQAEALAKANERLRELTITDSLTGLYNRRHFTEVADVELRRAHRDRESVGFIMLDIDHFKKLNDCLGHQAGDEALQKIASAFQSCLRRPSDYCFRIGGEEFAILTTDTSSDSIAVLAETLRTRVAELRLPNPGHSEGIVTVSVGVAISNANAETASDLYVRADSALYRAKAAGRNRIVLSDFAA